VPAIVAAEALSTSRLDHFRLCTAFSQVLQGRLPAAAMLPCIADIGLAPNDALHDCEDRDPDYNEHRAARSNDAAFLQHRESADGKVDPF
jgi:hypothetical protein